MKNESIQSLHPGDRFDYAGLEWVVLDPDKEGGVLAITAEPYYDSAPFSRYFKGRDDWRKSILGKRLQEDLLPLLGEDNLLIHIVDLVADNGDRRYGTVAEKVFLLTCDEYRKYREAIPQYSCWIWTCTPWDTMNVDGANYVRTIGPDGCLYSTYAFGEHGAAPACIFNPRNLKLR